VILVDFILHYPRADPNLIVFLSPLKNPGCAAMVDLKNVKKSQ